MIIWDENFAVGSSVLDAQHKQLFAIINELERIIEDNTNDSDSQFHIVLHQLSDYAQVHFNTEENIIRLAGYARTEDHIEEHYRYRENLSEFLFDATMAIDTKRQLHDFLVSWWTNHVLKEDMAFKRAIQRIQ